MPFSLSCDRSSQETLKITLFYQPGRLVKISWKSLDISSNDMSGCRFWVDFQEKFAFNWAKCYSNHCNYRREKRVTLYNYSKAPALSSSCSTSRMMISVRLGWCCENGHSLCQSCQGCQMSAVTKCNTDGSQRQPRLLYGFTWYHKAASPGLWCSYV